MFEAATVRTKTTFSRKAGHKLGESLVSRLKAPPSASWLFASPNDGLEALLRGVREAVGTDVIVGCTTDGEISNHGFDCGSAVLGGVVSDQIEFQAVSVLNIGRDCQNAGRSLAHELSPEVKYLQLFSDGLTGNGCALLRGMYSILKKETPVAGGTAGDAGQFRRTFQFHGGRLLSNAAVAIGFSGNFQLGMGISSGWSPLGLPKRVTRASGNTLYELNDQPALAVYTRFLGKHAKNLPGVGVEYPLGLVAESEDGETDEDLLLRATMSVNQHDGSISFAGEIPEGAMVRLTCGGADSIVNASGRAARLAMEQLQDARPCMAFLYSCMARRIVLGRRIIEEIDKVREEVGGELPLLGFYSYGEFSRPRINRPSLLYNETAAVSVIGLR